MHAISSYCGNRPTNKQTHKQDRLQYTAPQLARSVKIAHGSHVTTIGNKQYVLGTGHSVITEPHGIITDVCLSLSQQLSQAVLANASLTGDAMSHSIRCCRLSVKSVTSINVLYLHHYDCYKSWLVAVMSWCRITNV